MNSHEPQEKEPDQSQVEAKLHVMHYNLLPLPSSLLPSSLLLFSLQFCLFLLISLFSIHLCIHYTQGTCMADSLLFLALWLVSVVFVVTNYETVHMLCSYYNKYLNKQSMQDKATHERRQCILKSLET